MSKFTPDAILNLVPNAAFSFNGTDITWADDRPQPTDAELQTEIARLESEEPLNELRAVRDRLLADTDWWASSDLTMTAEQTAYRQALRDITETYSSLDDVNWPVKP